MKIIKDYIVEVWLQLYLMIRLDVCHRSLISVQLTMCMCIKGKQNMNLRLQLIHSSFIGPVSHVCSGGLIKLFMLKKTQFRWKLVNGNFFMMKM